MHAARGPSCPSRRRPAGGPVGPRLRNQGFTLRVSVSVFGLGLVGQWARRRPGPRASLSANPNSGRGTTSCTRNRRDKQIQASARARPAVTGTRSAGPPADRAAAAFLGFRVRVSARARGPTGNGGPGSQQRGPLCRERAARDCPPPILRAPPSHGRSRKPNSCVCGPGHWPRSESSDAESAERARNGGGGPRRLRPSSGRAIGNPNSIQPRGVTGAPLTGNWPAVAARPLERRQQSEGKLCAGRGARGPGNYTQVCLHPATGHLVIIRHADSNQPRAVRGGAQGPGYG